MTKHMVRRGYGAPMQLSMCYIGGLGLPCVQTTDKVCYGLVLEPTGSLAEQSFVPHKKRDLYVTTYPCFKRFQATKASHQILGPAGTLISHQTMDAV